MNNITIIAVISIIMGGLTVALAAYPTAKGQSDALSRAIEAISRQPENNNDISRIFFIGAAFIESIIIYCLVISLIILFANPFIGLVAGK